MLILNRDVFFEGVRNGPFPGKLTQAQVDGMNDLLDAWEKHGTNDPRHLAYTLATYFHETGAKMQPTTENLNYTSAKRIREVWPARFPTIASAEPFVRNPKGLAERVYGGRMGNVNLGDGWLFRGRGGVQITGRENYRRMGTILKLPLETKPDLALDPKVSSRILIEGMLRGVSLKGDFTGVSLEDFFKGSRDDAIGARRIVNGTDRAKLIAGYHEAFLDDIKRAVAAAKRGVKTTAVQPPRVPSTDETAWGGVIQAVGGVAAASPALFERLPGWVALVALAAVLVGTVMVVQGRRRILRETGE